MKIFNKLNILFIIIFLIVIAGYVLRLPVRSHGDNLFYMAAINRITYGIKTSHIGPIFFETGKPDMHNYPLIVLGGYVNLFVKNTEISLYIIGFINLLITYFAILYFSKNFLKFNKRQTFLLLLSYLFLQPRYSDNFYSPGIIFWMSTNFNPEISAFTIGLLSLTFFEKILKNPKIKYLILFILSIFTMCVFDQIVSLGFVFVFLIYILCNIKIIIKKLPILLIYILITIISVLFVLKIYPFFDIYDYFFASKNKISLLTNYIQGDIQPWYLIVANSFKSLEILIFGIISLMVNKFFKNKTFILSTILLFILFPLFKISPIKIAYYWRYYIFVNFFMIIGLTLLFDKLIKKHHIFLIVITLIISINVITKIQDLLSILKNYKVENLDNITMNYVNNSQGTILSDPWTSYRAAAWTNANIYIYNVPEGHYSAPGWFDCNNRIKLMKLINSTNDSLAFDKLLDENNVNLIIVQKLPYVPFYTSIPTIKESLIPINKFIIAETENYRIYKRISN